jgi:DNA/RNA-binding domain of Phe-tRNA-synthetase-like protein
LVLARVSVALRSLRFFESIRTRQDAPGAEGEKYAGIRKDEVNVGGRITVADDIGAFGNPTSDSARTMVTPSTTALLVIVYAPDPGGQAQVERVLSTTAERVALAVGGRYRRG